MRQLAKDCKDLCSIVLNSVVKYKVGQGGLVTTTSGPSIRRSQTYVIQLIVSSFSAHDYHSRLFHAILGIWRDGASSTIGGPSLTKLRWRALSRSTMGRY